VRSSSSSRTRFPLLPALFFLFFSCCQGPGRGETPSSPGGSRGGRIPTLLGEALEKARKEKKLVLVEIFDPSCKYCRAMEEVFPDPRVRRVLENFLWIRLNLKGNPLVKRFHLDMTPAFLVFSPDGKAMEDILEGFRSAPVFAAELEDFRRLYLGEEEVEIPEDRHPMAGKGCRIGKGR